MRKKIGPKIKLSANPARTVFHDEVGSLQEDYKVSQRYP